MPRRLKPGKGLNPARHKAMLMELLALVLFRRLSRGDRRQAGIYVQLLSGRHLARLGRIRPSPTLLARLVVVVAQTFPARASIDQHDDPPAISRLGRCVPGWRYDWRVDRRRLRQIYSADIRHRPVYVWVKAQTGDSRLLKTHRPKTARIKTGRTAGIWNRPASGQTRTEPRGADTDRAEAGLQSRSAKTGSKHCRYVR